MTTFTPEHINATADDLAGNNGIGRYIILPGSDGRAKEISKHFDNVTIKPHPRDHNLYLGSLQLDGKTIDVASVASGMGCPSMEIILHELFHLGAKRFLRVGTAGPLQKTIKIGDIINAQAAVRDENTTTTYAPIEFPAVASLEFTSSILLTAEKMGISQDVHTGVVHCKSALYAREFGAGPKTEENNRYMQVLSELGVLASEMETAALFIQTQLYNHQLRLLGDSRAHHVLSGAILAINTTQDKHIDHSSKTKNAIKREIELAIESIKTLASQELFD